MSLSKHLKIIKRKIGRILIGSNPHDLAYFFCRGNGLEIGARNSPYVFGRNCKVLYADIGNEQEIQKTLESVEHKKLKSERFVKVTYVLTGPRFGFDQIDDNSFDFVYSDNVLEHTPNPIYALAEQIRIIKNGGVVYTVIPNKKYIFDKNRIATSVDTLKQKYNANIFHYTLEEALDVVNNSEGVYEKPANSEEALVIAKKMIQENDGSPHYHVFDEKNTIQMICYVAEISNSTIEYFSAPQGRYIHFAIRKQ
jgi:ubiquinone/menaquinone biosynthesis C-methylase UbiE